MNIRHRHRNRLGFRLVAMLAATTITFFAGTGSGMAHAPLLNCFENDEKTAVTCEAGYSDGASAAGQMIRVREASGRLILEAVFDPSSSFVFDKPGTPFFVEFIGDPSHVATFDGDDLDDQ